MSLRDHDDEGSIVLGWMTKLVIAATIVGVAGFDGITVGVAHLSTADDANNAVQAASQSYEKGHNLQLAYAAAVATVNAHEKVDNVGFVIQPDGTTTLTVVNTVKTLVLSKTSATKGWAVISVTATGKYTGS